MNINGNSIDMNDYWNLTHGVGWSKCNPSIQGIPESNPRWVKSFSENGAGLDPLISYSESLYFLSSSNDSSLMSSIDINTGRLNWSLERPRIHDDLPSMCATDKYIIVSDWLLTADGREVGCLIDLLEQENPQENTPFDFGDKYILRIIDHEVNPYKYFLYDLEAKEYKNIILPVFFGALNFGNDLVYGFSKDGETTSLVCCTVNGDVLWEEESPVSAVMFNENVMSLTEDNISLLSSENGRLIKRISSMENNFTEDKIYSFDKSYSKNTVNVVSGGDLSIFSISENRLIKKIEGASIHDHCVAGDLIFTCQNTWDLVAYDKYSGQEVWRYTERYAWQSLIASNNKLIIYCATGDIVCFDCGEPYISPNRPG